MEQEDQIYTPSGSTGRLRQGEILSGLKEAWLALEQVFSDKPVVILKSHPLAIVMTQDCDLESDYRDRRATDPDAQLLPNVLFCEVTTARALRHQKGINSPVWGNVRTNKNERYQYLREVDRSCDAQGEGLEAMGIDFRRYFTVPTAEVYVRLVKEAKRRCRLESPSLEHLSTRFYYFQLRVGLPAEHFVRDEVG